jgi:hypothetical protein
MFDLYPPWASAAAVRWPSERPGRERTALEQESARPRKREALERFVDKNAKVLAELAK